MDAVSIATEAEALAILNAEGVRDRIGVEPDAIRLGSTYLVNGRMLLILIPQLPGVCELHIAMPRESWRWLHGDIDQALKFVNELGYNEAYTTVTEHLATTQNLIKKHGFKEVDRIAKERIYKWVSKPQY